VEEQAGVNVDRDDHNDDDGDDDGLAMITATFGMQSSTVKKNAKKKTITQSTVREVKKTPALEGRAKKPHLRIDEGQRRSATAGQQPAYIGISLLHVHVSWRCVSINRPLSVVSPEPFFLPVVLDLALWLSWPVLLTLHSLLASFRSCSTRCLMEIDHTPLCLHLRRCQDFLLLI
jgi:hypothetical protein